MDRQIVYSGQVPLETDLLNSNRDAMIGLGKLAAAVLGTGTLVNGLACTATAPASMQVQVAPGEIYSMAAVDASAYGSLAADTAHQIQKQGILLDALTLSCPAPATAGYSISYLVEAGYSDLDADAVVLPYYNSSNPAQAFSGPGGSGAAQATVRRGACNVALKAGAAAPTGSQTAPAPDAGYAGLWVVTVAYGQTAITAANISRYAAAPIMPAGGLLGALQAGSLRYADDSGAVNAYAVNLPLPPAAYYDGMEVSFSTANASTLAAPTLNVNGLGAVTITNPGGAALVPGQIAPYTVLTLHYNSTGPRFELVFSESTGDLRYQLSGADGSGSNKVYVSASTQLTNAHSGKTLDLWPAPAGTSLALPLTSNNTAPRGFNLVIGPNQNGASLALPAASVINAYAADGSVMIAPNGSLALPGGVGRAWRVYEFADSYRIETVGRTIVAGAVNANEAVALGQADARYAPLAGNPAQAYSVANATAASHALALGQSLSGGAVSAPPRSAGVWYTNTSNRPRWVSIGVWLNLYVSCWLYDSYAGTQVSLGYFTTPSTNATNVTLTGLVLPGHSYMLSVNGSSTINYWTEIV